MSQVLVVERKQVFQLGTLVALALAASFASTAWAGRPLATEDAGVLGPGECEVESYVGRDRDRSSERVNTRWAQFGCGIGRATQLSIGAGAESSAGERTAVVVLTGKTFLRELTDDQTGLALAYTLIGVKVPGNSFRHDATELKAVVSIPYHAWLLHGNLGANFSRLSVYSTVWGVAVERPGAVGPVDLMAEVFGDNHTAPWVQVGARWTVVPERIFLDASWGAQTNGDRAKQVTMGLKVAF